MGASPREPHAQTEAGLSVSHPFSIQTVILPRDLCLLYPARQYLYRRKEIWQYSYITLRSDGENHAGVCSSWLDGASELGHSAKDMGGHPQSPPHGSVTRQGTTEFEGMSGACCVYIQNLLTCDEEEDGMEHIWLPDFLFIFSWLRTLAMLGAGA